MIYKTCSNPFCGLEAPYIPARLRSRGLPAPDAIGFCTECEYEFRGLQCTRCSWKHLFTDDYGEMYEIWCVRCGKPLGEEDSIVLLDTSPPARDSSPAISRDAWEELGNKAVRNGDVRSRPMILAALLHEKGQTRIAVGQYHKELALCRDRGWKGGEASCLLELGQMVLEEDPEVAWKYLRKAELLSRELDNRLLLATCLGLQWLLLQQGDAPVDRQLRVLDEVIQLHLSLSVDERPPAIEKFRTWRADLRYRRGDWLGVALDLLELPNTAQSLRKVRQSAGQRIHMTVRHSRFSQGIPGWGKPGWLNPGRRPWLNADLVELMNYTAFLYDFGKPDIAKIIHKRALQKWEEIAPSVPGIANDYGRLLQVRCQHNAAATAFLRGIRHTDSSTAAIASTLYNNLGISLGCLGKYARAEESLRRSIEFNAQSPNPYFWLARIYYLRRRQDDMLHLGKAVERYLSVTETGFAESETVQQRRQMAREWLEATVS